MKKFLHLTFVLALVSALAAGSLAFVYSKTKVKIAEQAEAAKVNALKDVFFHGFEKATVINENVTAIYLDEEDEQPSYYAVLGSGVGYNTAVPIELMVGFVNPACDAAKLLPGYADRTEAKSGGLYLVGWKVVKSEETPGLGEKAKDRKAPCTWAEGGLFSGKEPLADARTDFQKQFAGADVRILALKKDGGTVDVITAATYSTRGIVAAIKDAEAKLNAAVK
jgi:Na+-translocating ferredoxin:NAD+ oxidoreductase RnfG subunit